MAKRLPPLNPLKVFEVTARLESVTKASKELFITQAAVSRQIVVLEEYLGEQLFIHRRGKIRLTDVGRSYYQAVSTGLGRIHSATEQLVKSREQHVIRLKTYQTFAHNWLIPRLSSFKAKHPDIEIHVLAQVAPVDMSQASFDVAIQFGEGSWPGFKVQKILDDEIAPVCSPAYRDGKDLTGEARKLENAALLHADYRRRDWADWLESANLKDLQSRGGLKFQSSELAYQAARHGLGVAMGQIDLLEEDLSSGRLVMPFDQPLRRPLGYYLIHSEDRKLSAPARHFVDWLLSTAGARRNGRSRSGSAA